MEKKGIAKRILAGALTLCLGGCSVLESIANNDNSKEVNYQVWQGEEDKTPVVLNHCFLGDIDTMGEEAKYFHDKGHTILLWEYPWHGNSPYYVDPINRPATVTTITKTLDELLKKLEIENPILCGWSLGGIISLDYAIEHPENYSGIVIIGSAHDGRGVWQHYIDERILKQKEEMLEKQARSTPVSAILSLAYNINQTYLDAEQIEKPVVAIVGDQDEFFKNSVFKELRNELNKRGEGCRFCVIEGADHLIQNLNVTETLDAIGEDGRSNYDYLFGNEVKASTEN